MSELATSADVTHEVPAPVCTEQVDLDMLMCPRHWYQVRSRSGGLYGSPGTEALARVRPATALP